MACADDEKTDWLTSYKDSNQKGVSQNNWLVSYGARLPLFLLKIEKIPGRVDIFSIF